jgi:hypothetical protein
MPTTESTTEQAKAGRTAQRRVVTLILLFVFRVIR